MSWATRICSVALVLLAVTASTLAIAGKKKPNTCEDPSITGRVISVKNLRVHVDMGSKHGVEKGMRVAVIPKSAVKDHPKYGPPFMCGDNPDVTAIVELDEVGETTSSGIIGRASAATKGDAVVVTSLAPTDRRRRPVFPHQYGNIWDVSLRFRILADVAGDGAGFPMELMFSYQFAAPVKITAFMAPSFFGTQEGGDSVATVGLMLAYSSRFFELGFGLGGYHLRGGRIHTLAFQQKVRIGAEHGLRLEFLNSLVWDHDGWGDDRGLRYDSTIAEIVIPVHARVALYLEGGGGGENTDVSWMRITTGVHIYVRGTGGPGTIVVPIGIGGGYVDLDVCDGDMCFWNGYYGVYFVTGVEASF
ncbi:MAG: hypothetical protein JRG91_17585 [Deltaproteobacteria bacterium]|nr:hypothetical protein [Deltaproteobacteria bacterium]